MQLVTHNVTVNAPANLVWQELVHWETWPSWDRGMERISFDGPIDVGSIGKLKLKAGPEVLLHVSALEEGIFYTDYFDYLGTRFVFYHRLGKSEGGRAAVDFSVDAQGPLAIIVGNLVRLGLARNLSKWMNNLKTRCEKMATATA